ncbi:hypothetical protein HDU93_009210 [Gonapodya sp. JEL0774]|nr:hypothetical protein HDU93_009210 [Gonapodya sp. JEL0774]
MQSRTLTGMRSQGSAVTFEAQITSGRRSPRGRPGPKDALPIIDHVDDGSPLAATESDYLPIMSGVSAPTEKKSALVNSEIFVEDTQGSQHSGFSGQSQRKMAQGMHRTTSSSGGGSVLQHQTTTTASPFSPNGLLGAHERMSTLERRRVSVDMGQVQLAMSTGPVMAGTLERRRGAGDTLRRMSLVSEAIARGAAVEAVANPVGDFIGGKGVGSSSKSVRSRS